MITASHLQEVVRREGRSLLQYIAQAEPWVGPDDQKVWDRVQEMARDEHAALEEFADELRDARVTVSHPGAFPMSFTGLHFTALRSLMPRVIDDHRRTIAVLDGTIKGIPEGSLRSALEQLLAGKREHLDEMISLSAPVTQGS